MSPDSTSVASSECFNVSTLMLCGDDQSLREADAELIVLEQILILCGDGQSLRETDTERIILVSRTFHDQQTVVSRA